MTFPYPRIIAFMRVDIKVIKCISIPAFAPSLFSL